MSLQAKALQSGSLLDSMCVVYTLTYCRHTREFYALVQSQCGYVDYVILQQYFHIWCISSVVQVQFYSLVARNLQTSVPSIVCFRVHISR